MNKWIKVEDKLPASSTMVLLHAPMTYGAVRGILFGWYDSYTGNFLHHHSVGYSVIQEDMVPRHKQKRFAVTHWMSLPEGPEND